MEEQKEERKIKIIIGNGFDLECGLHSKFSDYFFGYKKINGNRVRGICDKIDFNRLTNKISYCITKYIEYSESHKISKNTITRSLISLFKKYDLFDKINFWEYWFFTRAKNNHNPKWMDVEQWLYEGLINIKSLDKETDLFTMPLGSLPSKLAQLWINIKTTREYCQEHLLIVSLFFFIKKILKNPLKYNEYMNLRDILLLELNDFEKSFSSFLKSEIKYIGKETFKNKAFKLINKITQNKTNKETLFYSIDSFNYTTYDLKSLSNKYKNIKKNKNIPIITSFNSLHGRLNIHNIYTKKFDDNIIVGIDNEYKYKTKTEISHEKIHKKIKIVNPIDENLLYFSKSERRRNLFDLYPSLQYKNDDFNEIIIFGHSLGKQDRQYFFSLFDQIKLYDLAYIKKDNIKIIFYYYSKGKDSEYSNKLLNVRNLFFEYQNSKNFQVHDLLATLELMGVVEYKKIKGW